MTKERACANGPAMSRRSLLAAIPASGALLALPSSAPAAADPGFTYSEPTDAADKIRSLRALPFVRDTTRKEQRAGLPPRLFWSVQPTGDYYADCITGNNFAKLALDHMAKHRMPETMQWAVFNMMRAGHERSGIEVGFLSVLGQYAMGSRMIVLGNLPSPDEYQKS